MRHELDQRRPEPGARALGRPGERRGNRVGIGAVDRDARECRSRRPCRRTRGPRTDRATGVDSAVWLFCDAEDRRQPPRGAQVDRLVPFAERRSAFADERQRHAAATLARERHRHAGNRQRADRERRGGRQDAPARNRRCADPCRPSAGRPCPSAPTAPCAPSPARAASRARRRDRG